MPENNIFEYKNLIIEWIGHDSFKISDRENGKIIYTDPYQLSKYNRNLERADIILVTHSHYDHYDPESIKMIANDNTRIFVPKDYDGNLKVGKITLVEPEIDIVIENIRIETVPAYNINKPYHPRSKNWVGYIITINDVRIYHAGDTDLIPEMNRLGKIDIALLPVSGTYVMNAEEAAKACSIIKPKIAIPMHYGTIIGSREDAEKFKELAPCEVKIL
ncbi:MAG: MBL fold metallo-hydrolase [Nitrospiraceae bacterium]|nr:MBL fold metallo-hydrolase [Nitrospiraceae bacterium]